MNDDRDRGNVRTAVVAMTAVAWVLLIRSPGTTPHHRVSAGAVSIGTAMTWFLMFVAMMAPVLIAPIQFVRGSSFARRRTRSMLLFSGGYAAIWIFAGVAMLSVAGAMSASIAPPYMTVVAVLVIALIWQCSPPKQISLNRCHTRPTLAAFGRAADTDALTFGLSHGVSCVGSCWAWMLLPLLVPAGHLAAMVAVAILIVSERLDKPAPPVWRWRGLAKVRRTVIGQVRLRMGSHVYAR